MDFLLSSELTWLSCHGFFANITRRTTIQTVVIDEQRYERNVESIFFEEVTAEQNLSLRSFFFVLRFWGETRDRGGDTERRETLPSPARLLFVSERVRLPCSPQGPGVARLTVLSRSSRKILSSAATRARDRCDLRADSVVILSFRRVAEIFQRQSPIRSPITFIDRPRYHGLSRAQRFFSIERRERFCEKGREFLLDADFREGVRFFSFLAPQRPLLSLPLPPNLLISTTNHLT